MNCSSRPVLSTATSGSCDVFGSLSSHNTRKVSCVDTDIKPTSSLGDFKQVTGRKQLYCLKKPPTLHTCGADHMGVRRERATDRKPVQEKAAVDGSHCLLVWVVEWHWSCA